MRSGRTGGQTKASACALLAASLASVAAGPLAAHEIYKWVDASGVVHYGDERPESSASRVETLHIPEANPPGYDPAAATRAIVEEARRIRAELVALREARQEEAARERAEAAEARLAELERRLASAEAAAHAARGIYAPFGSFWGHRLQRPDLRHRHPHRPPPRARPETGPRPAWPGPGE